MVWNLVEIDVGWYCVRKIGLEIEVEIGEEEREGARLESL